MWKTTGNRKRDVLNFVIYCLQGYLMAALVIVLAQRFFLYYPLNKWDGQPQDYQATAAQYETKDGVKLTSWYCPPQGTKPVFIMFHGNGGNISIRGFKQEYFCTRGYGFLLAEYRGYGGNRGSPNEDGLYNDGRAAISWLNQKQGISEDRIIIYGESIGTGVAVQMAIEYKKAKALILEAPLTSVPDLVRTIMPWMKPFSYMVLDNYDNLAKAPYIEIPTFVVQGSKDEVIPVEKGKTLYAAVGSASKSISILPGGHHNDLADFGLLPSIDGFVLLLK